MTLSHNIYIYIYIFENTLKECTTSSSTIYPRRFQKVYGIEFTYDIFKQCMPENILEKCTILVLHIASPLTIYPRM